MPLYQRVFYITPDDPIEVQPQTGGGGALGYTLFTTPRVFAYNGGLSYNLDREGLLAFMASDVRYNDGGFRIVTRPDGTMSVTAVMQAMAAICQYGQRDEGVSAVNLRNTAKYRKLAMRCGPTTEFVLSVCAGLGMPARQVHLVNVTNPNGFDDGHTILEAREGDGPWTLYDVPNNIAFRRWDGSRLSLADTIAIGVANCTIEQLARVESYAQPWAPNFPALDIVFEAEFATPAKRAAWLRRIYEVPGVLSGNKIYWGMRPELSSYASVIEGYAPGVWIPLPWSEWRQMFYP